MSRDFDGSSADFLSLAALPLGGYPYTMSGWFNPDTSHFGCIYSEGSSVSTAIYHALFTRDTGEVSYQVRDGSGASKTATTSTTYSTGTWNHALCLGVSSTDRKVYLNGGGEGTETSEVDYGTSDQARIGQFADSSASDFFDGRLEHVAVWSAVLTAGEITALAGGIHPIRVRPESLAGYWPIHGLYSPEPDWSGNGNNMTVNSAPPQASGAPVGPMVFPTYFDFAAAGGGGGGAATASVVTVVIEPLAATAAPTASLVTLEVEPLAQTGQVTSSLVTVEVEPLGQQPAVTASVETIDFELLAPTVAVPASTVTIEVEPLAQTGQVTASLVTLEIEPLGAEGQVTSSLVTVEIEPIAQAAGTAAGATSSIVTVEIEPLGQQPAVTSSLVTVEIEPLAASVQTEAGGTSSVVTLEIEPLGQHPHVTSTLVTVDIEPVAPSVLAAGSATASLVTVDIELLAPAWSNPFVESAFAEWIVTGSKEWIVDDGAKTWEI